jgi:hypothetical protein
VARDGVPSPAKDDKARARSGAVKSEAHYEHERKLLGSRYRETDEWIEG